MTYADVTFGDEPDRETSSLDLGTDVRAGGNYDEELKLDTQGQKIVDVAVAAKVVLGVFSWGMVAPVDVDADGVEAHGLDVGEDGEPSLAVGDAEILELSRDNRNRAAANDERGVGPVDDVRVLGGVEGG